MYYFELIHTLTFSSGKTQEEKTGQQKWITLAKGPDPLAQGKRCTRRPRLQLRARAARGADGSVLPDTAERDRGQSRRGSPKSDSGPLPAEPVLPGRRSAPPPPGCRTELLCSFQP